jgi:flagellar protein FliS
MLYDGAIRFLERALIGFTKDDPAEFNETINNNIIRAQDIVNELNNSLNVQAGGELAMHLRRIYQYVDHHLTQSNLRKEEKGIQDSLRRLTILREAWAEMLGGQTAPALETPMPLAELAAA